MPLANRISTTSFNGRDAATLAAAATFQGVGEDVSGYGRVGIGIKSDNSTATTVPLFAKAESRRDKDIPLITISPGEVAAGTTKPPGHMQKECTPRFLIFVARE